MATDEYGVGQPLEAGKTQPHPGVAPPENEETTRHRYYQWVIFFFFVQAMMFYLPR